MTLTIVHLHGPIKKPALVDGFFRAASTPQHARESYSTTGVGRGKFLLGNRL
jgi:hypothetical protein